MFYTKAVSSTQNQLLWKIIWYVYITLEVNFVRFTKEYHIRIYEQVLSTHILLVVEGNHNH